ncbi:MAG: type I-C CRISPR-associated protein Cas5 [candidate division WS1 bacterium]|jgi:CRISPR-associated protein Cas5d|nr:type I-C CRISPR-associated protein Cas5 [candidate division WS1 bacterium]
MQPKDQVLEVWGELACFTRPELKVERFSYPVITPSAARGIYDAIYCKPCRNGTQAEFRWQITQIEVLCPPNYLALRRNEVKEKGPSERMVRSWMTGKTAPEPLWADGAGDDPTKGRTQRQTMALKDVRYRLHAEIRPWEGFKDRQQAFEAQFRRRAAEGKCIFQPYFGCREFPAYFELIEPGAECEAPWDGDADLGLMLYDAFDLSRPGTSTSPVHVSLFRCRVVGGVITVPDYDSPDVLRVAPEGGEATC